uniref:Uncharacterized protein n=1 Tax=Felis catus TaxID=9685 RepID=A0ABI8A9S9_FELCA
MTLPPPGGAPVFELLPHPPVGSCLLDKDTFLENFHLEWWPNKAYLCYETELPSGDPGVPLGQHKDVLCNKLVSVVENRHVTPHPLASRLYTEEGFQNGLRLLRGAGARITIMTSTGPCGFEHCWEPFVDNQGRAFEPRDTLVSQSQDLAETLQGSRDQNPPPTSHPVSSTDWKGQPRSAREEEGVCWKGTSPLRSGGGGRLSSPHPS